MAKLKSDNPDQCISCNICLTACPVARATRKYRGPKLTGPALTRLRMLIEDQDPMLQYCSNCKNCDRVCPSGTPISTLNMKARSAYYKKNPHTLAEKILSNNELMGKTITSIPFASTIANLGMKITKAAGAFEIVGMSSKAPFPTYAKKSFSAMFKSISQPKCDKKVLFFPGCYVNYNEPQVGVDLVHVFNHNNIEVLIDDNFVCCGSPMISAGYIDKVQHNADINSKILASYAKQGIDIITTCTTCALILKQEYDELFELEAVKEYNVHMYDAIEYLLNMYERGELKTDFKTLNKKEIYHTPCHLKVQGYGKPTLKLLNKIPGVEVVDADAGCCGLSGIYGYKTNTAEVAAIVGSKLQKTIKESDAHEGVCECNICRLQMQNNTGKKAYHPLHTIRQAYGV